MTGFIFYPAHPVHTRQAVADALKTVIPSARDRFSIPDLSVIEIYKSYKNINSLAQASSELVPLWRE
jgi:hypothetical protein